MTSSVCFLHHHIALPSTSLLHGHTFHRQVPSQLKPSKLRVLVKAQKQDVEDRDQSSNFDTIFSRRSAISVLVGSAALATQLSPANAALYGVPELAMAAPGNMIKVVAMYGSLTKCSRSRGLIRAAEEIAKNTPELGMDIETVEIGDLPLLNPDDVKEQQGQFIFPPQVKVFRDKLKAADCYLFATTEYNYAVTGAMKNAIDWASGWEGGPPNISDDKAVAIMSAGYELAGGLAQYNMRQMGVRLNLHFVNTPQVFVYLLQPPPKFDKNCNLIDEGVKEQIQKLLFSLKDFYLRLKD